MKTVTIISVNGVTLSASLTKSINLSNVVYYYEKAGNCVLIYDDTNGSGGEPDEYVLNITKAVFVSLIGYESTVTITSRNGVASPYTLTRSINLHKVIYFYDNASTKCVVRYDEISGSNKKPVSLTLSISATAFASIVGNDTTVVLFTGLIYNTQIGGTTSTKFNRDYIVGMRDAVVSVAGTKTASVEIKYIDGNVDKRKYASGALSSLVASNIAELLTFSFAAIAGSTTVLNPTARTIAATVPNATNVTALVATWTKSNTGGSSSIKVSTTDQVSGVTANNFTNPVTYILIAADGVTTRNWIVAVTVAPA